MSTLTKEQKAEAVGYVQQKYCIGSSDTIECDAEADDKDFSHSEEGVWVRTWAFVPNAEITGDSVEEGEEG